MKTRELQHIVICAIVILLLFAPPMRDALERTMTSHVLVQLAGLATAGWLLGTAVRRHLRHITAIVDANGISSLVLGLCAMSFWMLPRSLDESITDPLVEAIKLVTVPLLVGAPLAISWPRLNPVLRSLVRVKLISVLLILGWLYVAAPDRLCTNYYQSDQILLGQLMIVIAGVLAFGWALPWFIGDSAPKKTRNASAKSLSAFGPGTMNWTRRVRRMDRASAQRDPSTVKSASNAAMKLT